MKARTIVIIVCVVIAIICFAAAFLMGGEDASVSPVLIGVIAGVSGAVASKVLKKEDDK